MNKALELTNSEGYKLNTLFQGDSTYAITKSGLLCEFNNRRLLDKWVELRTTRLVGLYLFILSIKLIRAGTIRNSYQAIKASD